MRGRPRPNVEWFKDSVKVEKDNPKYHQIDHPDGTCELIVNFPHPNDSGKFVCKAFNRAGESEILHPMIFEGKEHHVINNRHRVYHADHQRVEQAKIDARGGIPLPAAPEKVVKAAETNADGTPTGSGTGTPASGKGKGRGRGGGNTRTESSPAPAEQPAAAAPPAPRKEEKRESKIGIYFASKLSDRVVVDGSKVKLTCYLEGTEPVVKWFRDDQPIVYSAKCKQSNLNGVCTLQLDAVVEADSGVYKCTAKNQSGEVTTTCNLQVFPSPGSGDAPPTFTRALKDTYHSNINEINLSCHVRGLPTPTITWLKDAVTIEPSEKYQIIYLQDGTCELNVNDPTRGDMGKYVCVAENRAGKIEISHLVQVQLKEPGSPRAVQQVPSTPLEEDTPGTPGSRAGGSETPASRAGGAETPMDSEGRPPAKGRKRQPKKEEESSGGGGGGGGGGRRRYEEPPVDPKTKLHFAAFLSDRTIAAGGKTKLSCYVQGPDPNVRWLKDENPVVQGPNCKALLRDGLITLELSNLTEAESGTYKVICRNPSTEINCSCNVLVYESIKVDKTPPLFTNSIKGNTALCWIVFVSYNRSSLQVCVLHSTNQIVKTISDYRKRCVCLTLLCLHIIQYALLHISHFRFISQSF